MGITLEFLIGNDEKIIEASKELDIDIFDEAGCIIKRADFSLHITPNDLNTLSFVAAKLNKQKAISLRDNLDLLIDEPDHGLFKVNHSWVKYFAMVEADKLESLAKEWYAEMQKQYANEIIEVTIDGIQAVKDLSRICDLSINSGKNVFHFWYL